MGDRFAGHRANRVKPAPSYIIDSRQELYHMRSQKKYFDASVT
ncbi:hypothetical protein [Sporosarcina sp. FA15]